MARAFVPDHRPIVKPVCSIRHRAAHAGSAHNASTCVYVGVCVRVCVCVCCVYSCRLPLSS